MTVAKPFFKWAGGKSALLPQLRPLFPFKTFEIDSYVEPFVGGGAVFFDVVSRETGIKSRIINDANPSVINAYCSVRDNARFLKLCREHARVIYEGLDPQKREEFYYQVRTAFNRMLAGYSFESGTSSRAAVFLVLNKLGFNGLYRLNKKGEFNVPFGHRKRVSFPDLDQLLAVSKALSKPKTKIMCGDYERILPYVGPKTFVFLDPPYRPVSSSAKFVSYTSEGFDDNEQMRLSIFARRLNARGAKFMITNSQSDDGFFQSLYAGCNIREIQAPRRIGRDGNSRKPVTELVITNY